MIKQFPILLFLATAAIQATAASLLVNPDESTVAVDVKASPPHSFTCDLQAYDAAIEIDPVSGAVSSAALIFQLTDLETHNEKRNKKMYDWMDTDSYNTIRWVLGSVESVDGRTVAHGEMTLHGVTQPVDIPFTASHVGDGFTLSGTANFNYMDFELPKIRLFIFTVKPELRVHFTLKGTLVSGE